MKPADIYLTLMGSLLAVGYVYSLDILQALEIYLR